MILCKKCGNDNPLGRVFCGACGSKLDLSGITTQKVEQEQRSPLAPLMAILTKLLLFLVAALIIGVVMAFWPNNDLLGKAGDPTEGAKVTDAMTKLRLARRGIPTKVVITEAEANAFLKEKKAKELGFQSASMVVSSNSIKLRLVKGLIAEPKQLLAFKFDPKVSVDMTCTVVDKTNLVVTAMQMGQIPTFGPLTKLVYDKMAASILADNDWKTFKDLSDLKLEEGKVTITVKK